MSWQQVATPHLGHRLTFKEGPWALRCVDCAVTLLIHREPHASSTTPTPPPWRPDRTDLVPMPEGLKERTLAEIAARKRAKQDGQP